MERTEELTEDRTWFFAHGQDFTYTVSVREAGAGTSALLTNRRSGRKAAAAFDGKLENVFVISLDLRGEGR
ncbi:MAG: hypothetical protein NDJ89_04235 [Oligoflexia bacterium]|nr:hypothetical protein [Oligoflexia bacterium]